MIACIRRRAALFRRHYRIARNYAGPLESLRLAWILSGISL